MLSALIPVVSMLVGAGTGPAVSGAMELANQDVVSTMRSGLVQQAASQGLAVDPDAVTYVTLGDSFLVHGPPVGADLHTAEEFAAGVDITFLYVGGVRPAGALPAGFYRVRATLPLGAETGQAQFISGSGVVVGSSTLFVRTTAQQDQFIPGSSDPGTGDFATITSTHIFRGHRQYVDAAGWTPYRVFYYEVLTAP
ncbi:hypothetical protein JYK02_22655 [Corallococcus macrosporus]|uniref:Uncharacterized protein n=1 Tax=Corallococcus macrosporus TaxID=35 RepID=A0ABS3DG74_9BACT|nr:hypothetical protein [Corallococcus macrosporus]MBN8230319.1 hypothetical protein [Corallococcus macrosporus]